MSATRVVLLTVLVVIVGAAVVKGTSDSGDKNPVASVANGAPRGLLALKLFLEARAVTVSVRRAPTDPAPLPGSVVLVPPPEASSISDAEVDALLAHARAGGTLLVVCDDEELRTARLAPLLKRLGVECFTADVPLGDIAATSTTALLPAYARTLTVRGLGRARPGTNSGAVPFMHVGADPFAALRALESGRALVLGSATVLTNDGLAHRDNAAFLLDVVATSTNALQVDERLHVGRGSNVIALARARGLGPLTLFLGVLLLVPLALLSLAPRRGDLPTRAHADGPPAAAAQVSALAALLARARR